MYHLLIEGHADREFAHLPKAVKPRIFKALEKLRVNPRHPGVIKLQGSKHLYRVRVGDYRIIFEIRDKALVIVVVRMGIRGDVYDF